MGRQTGISTNARTLKRRWANIDEIIIPGCTGSCDFDNFCCNRWWKISSKRKHLLVSGRVSHNKIHFCLLRIHMAILMLSWMGFSLIVLNDNFTIRHRSQCINSTSAHAAILIIYAIICRRIYNAMAISDTFQQCVWIGYCPLEKFM